LWDGGPAGVLLDFLPDVSIIKDVDGGETGQALVLENFTYSPTKATLGQYE